MAKDLKRALAIAAVVGTALSFIHGRSLFAGEEGVFRKWQRYASFVVPFLVSMVSSQLARRQD